MARTTVTGVSPGAVPVYDLGKSKVDLTHAMRVAADLEDEEIARELGDEKGDEKGHEKQVPS